MALGSGNDSGWAVPVVRTVASTGVGVTELVAAVSEFEAWLGLKEQLLTRRAKQWRERILEMVRGALLQEIRMRGAGEAEFAELALRVAGGVENPYLTVPELVERLRG